jgi:hypothetical protein
MESPRRQRSDTARKRLQHTVKLRNEKRTAGNVYDNLTFSFVKPRACVPLFDFKLAPLPVFELRRRKDLAFIIQFYFADSFQTLDENPLFY